METYEHHIHLLHIFLWAFLVIAICNLAALDFQAMKIAAQQKQTFHTVAMKSAGEIQSPIVQVSQTITPDLPTPSVVIPAKIDSQVKEFFVSFGSGTNDTDDWADVAALQVTVDSTQYSHIKKVVFEASVHIPTGNEKAYVRLFNITDKHPVWFSEMSMEGGTPQFLVSQPILLDSGVKTYQVQMKTSLKSQAILDQARLHMTIN